MSLNNEVRRDVVLMCSGLLYCAEAAVSAAIVIMARSEVSTGAVALEGAHREITRAMSLLADAARDLL